MADLTQLTDEELELKNQELMAARGEAEQGFKAQQMEVQAEVTRRADAARLARMADTLSEEDRAALKEYLEANPTPEPPAEEPEAEEETAPAAPDVEG